MLAKNHVLAGATHQMAHPYTKGSPGEQFYEPLLMLSRPFDGTAALNSHISVPLHEGFMIYGSPLYN